MSDNNLTVLASGTFVRGDLFSEDVLVIEGGVEGNIVGARVIVKARKGARGPFRLASPLVLHDGPAHLEDGDDFSAAARAILREGAGVDF